MAKASAAAALVCLSFPLSSEGGIVINPESQGVVLSGDARVLLTHQNRELRDGSKDRDDEAILRIRLGAEAALAANLRAKVRFAGRYSNQQDGSTFVFDDHVTEAKGMATGEGTLDEMWLDSKLGEEWRLRAGRFQTGFLPEGIAQQSIDRQNSISSEINWTDGIRLQRVGGSGWKPQAILQYNSPTQPSNVARRPLDFTSSGSRWGGAFSLDNREPLGPVVHREISATWLPNSLPDNANNHDDYWALVARGAVGWPLGNGARLLLTGQLGHAPNVPSRAPGQGKAGGLSTMSGCHFLDFLPNHSLALFYARAEDGWLISPSSVPNTSAWEGRYEWRMGAAGVLEVRVRTRQVIHPQPAQNVISDKEYYLRWTKAF